MAEKEKWPELLPLPSEERRQAGRARLEKRRSEGRERLAEKRRAGRARLEKRGQASAEHAQTPEMPEPDLPPQPAPSAAGGKQNDEAVTELLKDIRQLMAELVDEFKKATE